MTRLHPSAFAAQGRPPLGGDIRRLVEAIAKTLAREDHEQELASRLDSAATVEKAS